MIKLIKLESGDIVICNWNTVGHMAGWIDTLFKASQKLPKCGAVSALILDSKNKIFVHGSFIAPKINCPVSYAMGEEFFGQYPGTREVEATYFICGIIKKDLLKKIGLPENIGENPFVDADFCLEAQKEGFKIYATTELIVQYKGEEENSKDEKKFMDSFDSEYQKFNQKWGGLYNKKLITPVMYHTSIGLPSGFAMVARNYIKYLSLSGTKISYNYLRGTNEEEDDSSDQVVNSICEDHGDLKMPQIIWAQAPYFLKNSGAYKIGHAEFEGETLPPEWVDPCNMMDEIWVPTNWDREKFRSAGVLKPIYVFHQGIDKNYFHPDYSPMRFETKENFKFICNSAWDPRKNLPNLIKAFKLEFGEEEDVCLIIKTINLGLTKSIQEELKEIKYNKHTAKVYVKDENFSNEMLPSFYTAGDCYVSPTHGEAWGLPIFEALACGIPTITSAYGAPFEMLKDEKGDPLPGLHFIKGQKTLTDTPYVYLQGNFWFEPSIPQLQERMRYVFDHKESEKKKALITSQIVREKYDWANVVKPIAERIEKIYKTGF